MNFKRKGVMNIMHVHTMHTYKKLENRKRDMKRISQLEKQVKTKNPEARGVGQAETLAAQGSDKTPVWLSREGYGCEEACAKRGLSSHQLKMLRTMILFSIVSQLDTVYTHRFRKKGQVTLYSSVKNDLFFRKQCWS